MFRNTIYLLLGINALNEFIFIVAVFHQFFEACSHLFAKNVDETFFPGDGFTWNFLKHM